MSRARSPPEGAARGSRGRAIGRAPGACQDEAAPTRGTAGLSEHFIPRIAQCRSGGRRVTETPAAAARQRSRRRRRECGEPRRVIAARNEAAGRASRRARQRPPPCGRLPHRSRRPLYCLPHSSCRWRRRAAAKQDETNQRSKQACRPLRPLYPTLLVIRVFVGACLGTCVVSTNHAGMRLTWRLTSLLALATSLRRARRSLSLTTLCVETGVLTCVLTVYLRVSTKVSTQKYAKACTLYYCVVMGSYTCTLREVIEFRDRVERQITGA